jgi:hypothetical protein
VAKGNAAHLLLQQVGWGGETPSAGGQLGQYRCFAFRPAGQGSALGSLLQLCFFATTASFSSTAAPFVRHASVDRVACVGGLPNHSCTAVLPGRLHHPHAFHRLVPVWQVVFARSRGLPISAGTGQGGCMPRWCGGAVEH